MAGALRASARRDGHVLVLVLVSYAVLTIVFTWPVTASLGSRVAGQGADLKVALWDMWWFERAIVEGHSFLKTPYLYYPHGVALNYHSISWGSAALAFPFRQLFGSIAGYNVMVLLQTFTCAATMYLLAAYVVGRTLPAWLAGFVLAFEPARFARSMEHPNLAATGFVPLVFLGLLRAWRENRPAWACLSAASLGVVLLNGAHLFIMTCMAVAFLALWELVSARRLRDPAFWKTCLIFAAACVVCVGPWLLPFIDPSGISEAIESVQPSRRTNDPVLMLLPSKTHWLLGETVRPLHRSLASGAYLGLVAIALVAAATVNRPTRRPVLPWLVGLAVFLVLSLGARLTFAGQAYDLSLPYRLIGWLPPVQAVRSPVRFCLITGPFLAMCCAWGLIAVTDLLGPRRRWALGVLPLVMLDYLSIPFPTKRPSESAFFHQLAKRPGSGALVHLPLDRGATKGAMLSQTVHGRPLVSGMVARTPSTADAYIASSPLLRQLSRRPGKVKCSSIQLRSSLERLRHDGFEFIVIQKRDASRQERSAYREYFGDQPTFNDRHIEVYAIDPLLKGRLACDP